MTSPCDILKRREIVFHPLPPGQVERALALLSGLPGLTASQSGCSTCHMLCRRVADRALSCT